MRIAEWLQDGESLGIMGEITIRQRQAARRRLFLSLVEARRLTQETREWLH
jgi:hypothetical protein